MTALLIAACLAFPDPAPTVDELVARVVAAQKAEGDAKAEAQKKIAEATAKTAAATKELKAAVEALNAKLRELGLDVPAPTPVPPPAPADPLALTLRTAYLADLSPPDAAKKKEALLDLIEVYKQAQTLALSAELNTVSAVIAKVKAVATADLKPDDLKGVRTAVAAELRAAFPADLPLDAAGRAKLAAAFARIHAALSGVNQ
jgi:hypothetical protein